MRSMTDQQAIQHLNDIGIEVPDRSGFFSLLKNSKLGSRISNIDGSLEFKPTKFCKQHLQDNNGNWTENLIIFLKLHIIEAIPIATRQTAKEKAYRVYLPLKTCQHGHVSSWRTFGHAGCVVCHELQGSDLLENLSPTKIIEVNAKQTETLAARRTAFLNKKRREQQAKTSTSKTKQPRPFSRLLDEQLIKQYSEAHGVDLETARRKLHQKESERIRQEIVMPRIAESIANIGIDGISTIEEAKSYLWRKAKDQAQQELGENATSVQIAGKARRILLKQYRPQIQEEMLKNKQKIQRQRQDEQMHA